MEYYIHITNTKQILNKKLIKIIKIIEILFIILFFISINGIKIFRKANQNNLKNFNCSNKYFLFNFFNKTNIKNIYFNFTCVNYYYSFHFNLIKIEYNIGFYNKNNLLLPSNFSLLKKMNIICNIRIGNNKYIDSIANIKNNKFFQCNEFFNINEKIRFGIKICFINEEKKEEFQNFYFSTNQQNYKILKYKNDNIFNPLFIYHEYNSIFKNFKVPKLNETFKFKKLYINFPLYSLKRNIDINEDEWIFENIFNHYFCFCKGINCFISKISQNCKYYFYLNIIDENINVYNKTDFLFIDYIFKDQSSDDTYPVFQIMEKQGFPVHYITEKKDIYNKYCFKFKYNECQEIITLDKESYSLYGDFLEKYLLLILKLKAVISCKLKAVNYISNLFYNLGYITYISIGHGICYFKEYLYSENRLYGKKMNDKILIPPSKKIISIAKKYGWEDENIIKYNLPRWDKFNNYNGNISNNSIFIMFTWRSIRKNKKISTYYIENIISLLTNYKLIKILKEKNIALYFSFHRFFIYKYNNSSKSILKKNKYIKIIDQNEISNVLSKASLVISDFSSIIFDIMYRRKPFIIYIPDGNDENIKEIYSKEYYELINSMKNGSIPFENKYFHLNETLEKIIYYVKNNFHLETNLEKFYDSFELRKEDSIDKLIQYLNNL
jgi:hypothetical protein